HRLGVVAVVVELRRHEDLVTRQPGRRDRGTDASLVAVHLRGVDVPVTQLECFADPVTGIVVRDSPGAVAELWDQDAVVEGERGDRHGATLSACVSRSRGQRAGTVAW